MLQRLEAHSKPRSRLINLIFLRDKIRSCVTNVSRHGLTQSRPREHTPKISNKVIDPVEEGGMKATLTRVIKTVKTNRRNTVDDVIFSLEKRFSFVVVLLSQ